MNDDDIIEDDVNKDALKRSLVVLEAFAGHERLLDELVGIIRDAHARLTAASPMPIPSLVTQDLIDILGTIGRYTIEECVKPEAIFLESDEPAKERPEAPTMIDVIKSRFRAIEVDQEVPEAEPDLSKRNE